MPSLPLRFDRDDLARLFPYFVTVDRALRISDLGPSLAQLHRSFRPRARFAEVIAVSPAPTFSRLRATERQTTTLELPHGGPTLRGQWMYSKHTETLTFVGTPDADTSAQVAPHNEGTHERRGDFLALMSHELRTPLNAILGMNELARASRTTQEREQWSQRIDENAKALRRMIEGFLHLSEADGQQASIEPDPVDLTGLLERSVAPFGLEANNNGIEIILEVAPSTPRIVRVDSARLENLLSALVSNATKFTNEGHVHVLLRSNAVVGRAATIHIDVIDTGIGIAPEHHRSVFERFFRVDATTTRPRGGAGLGLSIAREQARLLGGTITLASTVDHGSRFTVTLTLPVVDAKPALDHDPRRPSVIVAEPYPLLREATARTLRTLGFRVRTCDAWNPEDSHAVGFDPRTVVLCTPPKADPDDPPERHLVTAMLASDHGDPLQRRFRVAAKPLGPYALLRLLTGRFEETAPSPDAPRRFEPLRVLVAEDNEDSRALVRAAMSRVGHQLDEAIDGRQALELATTSQYDIILLDIEMPYIDGIEVAARLRQRERAHGLPRIPMLAVTAHAVPEYLRRANDVGIDACVVKPISPRTLVEIVEHHCRQIPRAATPSATPYIASEPTPDRIGPDLARLDEDAASLLPLFLAARHDDLERIAGLLAADDYRALTRMGHNIKGTSASYGFPELSELGGRIEAAARDEQHDPIPGYITELASLMAQIDQWAASVGISGDDPPS